MKKRQVFAYLHTHWDREWYRDKEDFNLRLIDVLDTVLYELASNRAPFFYLDGQVIALLDYLKFRKNKTEQVIDFIKNKKLAIGPYFVSADSFLVNFCSMLKNLEIGMKISLEFGQKDFIGYLSDIFGVSNSAFEALKLKNINKAALWRGVNPYAIENNCNFIKNKINTLWLAQGYFNDFLHTENVEGLENYIDKIAKYSPDNILLPIGADHLSILQNASEKTAKINEKLKKYEIILSSPFEYFEKTKFKTLKNEPVEFLDNSVTYTLPGVYSARIYQKIKNAKIQNILSRIVEPFDCCLGSKYKENIEFIYKTLIKNHAHDGIYGCSLDRVHNSIDARFDKCANVLDALLKKMKGDFKKKYNISNKTINRIGIFNFSNYSNIKTVKAELPYIIQNSQVISKKKAFCDDLLYDINKIPVTENITSIYTQLVEIGKNEKLAFSTTEIKKPEKKVKVTPKSLENGKIKLEINKNRIFITNNKEKFELKLTDIKDDGDSYNFAPKGEYKIFELQKTKVISNGEIEACLALYFKNIVLYAKLNNHSEFLRFEAKINNKNKNHKIQAVLILKDNIANTISDDALGFIERKIDFNYKMQDFMPAIRPIELKTNSYPMQSFVISQSTGFLTKGLNEYEVYKNELRICLLRSIGTISNPKNKARSIPAGPDLKCPQAQCLGQNFAEFAVFFGGIKNAYKNYDEFFENYVVIDGQFNDTINLKPYSFPDDTIVYGINEGKMIGYDLKNKKISLI